MTTPSWLTSVPHNLGEPSHGKLKADQCRTIGTVYLPVSLARLWHTAAADDRRAAQCKKALSVTLSLISAIMAATSRSTSRKKAALYTKHMKDYLDGLRTLCPGYTFKPNHHVALHIETFLRLFGPVYGWWTYPFERLIGLLQRLPNNFKNGKSSNILWVTINYNFVSGQLEETISMTYVKSANLRSLLVRNACPPAIQNCQAAFTKLVNPEVRNTLLTDVTAFIAHVTPEAAADDSEPQLKDGTSFISEPSHKALRTYFGSSLTPRTAKTMTTFTMRGLTYSTFSRHKGNSSVIVKNTLSQSLVPAQIEDIIQTSNDDVLFAIRHYRHQCAGGPFDNWPLLQTSLWDLEMGSLVVVPSCDVVCHFASLSFQWEGQERVAIISLARVRNAIVRCIHY